MTALLALTGVLLLVSGGVKVRSGLRVGLGVHLATATEFGFALVVALFAAAGAGHLSLVQLTVPVGVALSLVSSVLFSVRMRQHRKRREELLERRLETYVRYLHRADDPRSDGP